MSKSPTLEQMKRMEDRTDRTNAMGERTFYDVEKWRTYKFCKKCGTFGRNDSLKKHHMKLCQPELGKDQSCFLKDGQLPEFQVEDFRVLLRMLGGSEKAMKRNDDSSYSNSDTETLSEAISQIDEDIQELNEVKNDCNSQQSFGQKSQISSGSKPQLDLSPKPKKEEQMVDTKPLSDNGKIQLNTKQSVIDSLFDKAQLLAQALRASSSYNPPDRTPIPNPIQQQSQQVIGKQEEQIEPMHLQTPSKSESNYPNMFSVSMKQSVTELLQTPTTKSVDPNASSKKRENEDVTESPEQAECQQPAKKIKTDDDGQVGDSNNNDLARVTRQINREEKRENTTIDSQPSNITNDTQKPKLDMHRAQIEYISNQYKLENSIKTVDPIKTIKPNTVSNRCRCINAEVARFAERFEDELMKWPRYRVKVVQDRLNQQLQKVVRLEENRSDILYRLQQTTKVNEEITRINQKLEATATSIADTIIPQHKKIINLKQHVADLYQQLGNSENTSYYKAMVENHEFDYIEPFVTKMMQDRPTNVENDAAVQPQKTSGEHQQSNSMQKEAAKKSKRVQKQNGKKKYK